MPAVKVTPSSTSPHQFLPVGEARAVDVGHHETVARCAVVGEQVYFPSYGLYRRVLQFHVGRHPDKLRVGLREVSHVEVVSGSCPALIEEHHGFLLVHAHAVEAHRVGRILVEQPVFALRCAQFVVVYLVGGVHIAVFFAFRGRIVGTVIEAVALPRCPRELGPLDVVVEQAARDGIHHVELLPVAAAARDAVSGIFAVVGEGKSRQCHRPVGRQFVGVEEHTGVAFVSRTIHHVEHALVLQSVVLVEIPLLVLLVECR